MNENELDRSTRILHLITDSDSVLVESALIAIRAQIADGYRVAVAARPEVLAALDLPKAPGLRLLEVPAHPRPHASDPQAALALHKLYRHVDVVHAHGLHAAALAGLALTGLPKSMRPVLIDSVGNSRSTDYFGASRRRFVARTATTVLGSNEAVVQEFAGAEVPAARAPLATPDVERRVRPSRSKNGTRAHLRLPGDVVLVASPVQLTDGDALTTIVEAALKLPNARADRRWAFAFTGRGPARATLSSELASRAPHLHLVAESEAVNVLAAADIVVAAEQMTGIDAAGVMQLRRPVVVVGDEDTTAAYGDSAIPVAPTDTHGLLDGIEYYADRPAIRTQRAFAAADRVLGTTTPAAIPARLEADYARALATA